MRNDIPSRNVRPALIVPKDGGQPVVAIELPIIGQDRSGLRYSAGDAVPKAIKARGGRYFVLDAAVDTVILTDKDGALREAPKTW